jgi:hypothetical protein
MIVVGIRGLMKSVAGDSIVLGREPAKAATFKPLSLTFVLPQAARSNTVSIEIPASTPAQRLADASLGRGGLRVMPAPEIALHVAAMSHGIAANICKLLRTFENIWQHVQHENAP